MPAESKSLIAACSVALALLVGCGSEEESTSSTSSIPQEDPFALVGPSIVSPEQIAEQPEGSPGKALLEWWQGFQFRDADSVVSLTSAKLLRDVGKNDLIKLVQAIGQGLQKITIVSANEGGNEATVRVLLLAFVPEKDGKLPTEPTSSSPRTFRLTEEGGEWRFDEGEYISELMEGLPK